MEHLSHYMREERPWGSFERFTLNEPATVKILTIHAGEAFSLQTHKHRDEFWRILSGNGVVTIGSEQQNARPGDTFFAPRGSAHRAEGGSEGLSLLEISFGDFDEQDITRLEDRYKRS